MSCMEENLQLVVVFELHASCQMISDCADSRPPQHLNVRTVVHTSGPPGDQER